MNEGRATSDNQRERVAVIIPAYNEEDRIGQVLEAVAKCSLVDEIIVVNDGSTDKTAQIASSYPVKLVNRAQNGGKGAAMQSGIKATAAQILAFIDADLIKLTPKHLEDMISPLIGEGNVLMTVGKFKGGRLRTDLAQKIVPFISGQRVFRRSFLQGIPDFSRSGFGVEVVITKHAKKIKAPVKEVILRDASQVMKEEKLGFLKGFIRRLKMYKEILVHLLFPGRSW